MADLTDGANRMQRFEHDPPPREVASWKSAYFELVVKVVVGGSAVIVSVIGPKDSSGTGFVLIFLGVWAASLALVILRNRAAFEKYLIVNLIVDLLLFGSLALILPVSFKESTFLLPTIITMGTVFAKEAHSLWNDFRDRLWGAGTRGNGSLLPG